MSTSTSNMALVSDEAEVTFNSASSPVYEFGNQEAFANNHGSDSSEIETGSSQLDSPRDKRSAPDDSSKSDLSYISPHLVNGANVSILGSGDFGRALAGRLVQAGYNVIIGSRNPERHSALVTKVGAHLVSQRDAIDASDIVIVAVPKDYYEDLPIDNLSGKVLVDVSNRKTVARKMALSQAEFLQSLVPNAHVVKAFNVLSAYSLESGGLQGSKEVYVASNNQEAKQAVIELVRACGFTHVDMGLLKIARDIEDIPVQQFSSWKRPLLISLLIFIFLYILSFAKYQICWTLTWGDGTWHWERWNYIPMETLNKTLSVHAITMLAVCYLPGVIAAYIQLIRGTKYSRFPNWLDKWLKMRKQFGLLMLFSASLHACISMAIMSPSYQDMAYGAPTKILADVIGSNGTHMTIEENVEVDIPAGKMGWRGESFLVCGVLAFALAVILGITSLPSVTAIMTWKEFAFVQSKLGWLCLLLAGAHNILFGWPYLLDFSSCSMPTSFQYCMYLPALTILLKIPLLFLSGYLDKIRGGWERGKGKRYARKDKSRA